MFLKSSLIIFSFLQIVLDFLMFIYVNGLRRFFRIIYTFLNIQAVFPCKSSFFPGIKKPLQEFARFTAGETKTAPIFRGVSGGRGWIRTIEAEKQQIYSLPPLATRELSHIKDPILSQDKIMELVDGLEPPTC